MSRLSFLIPLALVAAGCGSGEAESPASAPQPAGPTGRIAYTCGDESSPHICLIDADGSGYARLTADAFRDEAADWAPDGSSLVASRHEKGRVHLYRHDVRTGAAERLTPPGRDATYGRFSPDGKRLVFACPDGLGILDICVSRADGSGTRPLNPTPLNEFDPDWSPDGSQIVFARYFEESGPLVLVMNADGSAERRLAPGLTPSWSPDGQTLALSGGGLRLLDLETGEERTLTEGEFDTEPSWSPDGHWIVFRRGEMPDGALFIIGADGEGEQRVTRHGEPASLPSWSPAG